MGSTDMQLRLARLETVQSVVLDISRRSVRSPDLREFFRAVHVNLQRLMHAPNCYIALREGVDCIRYLYDVDEKDGETDPETLFPLLPGEGSPTAWVIRNGKVLDATAEQFESRGGWGTGTDAEHWLGMPLTDSVGETFGALVIQSYTPGVRYGAEDIALFELVSLHVAYAIEQVKFTTRLERAIADRTRLLQREVAERRHGEKLQHALYEISALSADAPDLGVFYQELHRILAELMYAKNLIITNYAEADDLVSFPYYADEKDPPPPPDFRRPPGSGLTGFVMTTRQPQRIDQTRYRELVAGGTVHGVIGSDDFNVWMGVPMIYHERMLGVIILQSYDNAISYGQDDLELLTFVAHHIATALSRKQADEALRTALDDLATSSRAVHSKNEELEGTLAELRLAQDELIRQEKLASLGALVAGVAHEINTPIGIGITAASHLHDQLTRQLAAQVANPLDGRPTGGFEAMAAESCTMILRNLQRADELVRSFKQVAVDQSSEQRRRFDLRQYTDEVLISLQPKLKRTPYRILVEIPAGIVMDTYPSAIYQILSNLVMNSIVHGFEGLEAGEMTVVAATADDKTVITFADNGRGMLKEVRSRIFDPFFTTRRGRGGTGLGMHIVYNLVTQRLKGRIEVASTLGEGTKFTITVPRVVSG